jgi:hypothetical protein
MIIFGVLHVSACSHKINTPSNVLHSLIYYFNTQLNINLTHNWLFTRRESLKYKTKILVMVIDNVLCISVFFYIHF